LIYILKKEIQDQILGLKGSDPKEYTSLHNQLTYLNDFLNDRIPLGKLIDDAKRPDEDDDAVIAEKMVTRAGLEFPPN